MWTVAREHLISTTGDGRRTSVGTLHVLRLGRRIGGKRSKVRDKTCRESSVDIDEDVAEDKRSIFQ